MSRPVTRHVRGYVWYCQIPGKLWVADQAMGYRLQFRRKGGGRPAGWWLTGGGLDVRVGAPCALIDAMGASAPLMERASRYAARREA